MLLLPRNEVISISPSYLIIIWISISHVIIRHAREVRSTDRLSRLISIWGVVPWDEYERSEYEIECDLPTSPRLGLEGACTRGCRILGFMCVCKWVCGHMHVRVNNRAVPVLPRDFWLFEDSELDYWSSESSLDTLLSDLNLDYRHVYLDYWSYFLETSRTFLENSYQFATDF